MDQAEFEAAVLAALPALAAVVPPTPGAELGRLELNAVDATPYASRIEEAYRIFPELLAERLFGALELTVAGLELSAPDELVATVQRRDTMGWVYAEGVPQSEMRLAVASVEGLRRGAGEVVRGGGVVALPARRADLRRREGDRRTPRSHPPRARRRGVGRGAACARHGAATRDHRHRAAGGGGGGGGGDHACHRRDARAIPGGGAGEGVAFAERDLDGMLVYDIA